MNKELDLEVVRGRAEAIWSLGWQVDEDASEIAAAACHLDIVLTVGDAPMVSVYDGDVLLLDAPLEDLHAALKQAYDLWRRCMAAVPPLSS